MLYSQTTVKNRRLRWLGHAQCVEGLRRAKPDLSFERKGYSRLRTFHLEIYGIERGHRLKLYKKPCRLNIRKHYFSQRIISLWNSLSNHVVTAPSVDCFKKRLDDLMAQIESQWYHIGLMDATWKDVCLETVDSEVVYWAVNTIDLSSVVTDEFVGGRTGRSVKHKAQVSHWKPAKPPRTDPEFFLRPIPFCTPELSVNTISSTQPTKRLIQPNPTHRFRHIAFDMSKIAIFGYLSCV